MNRNQKNFKSLFDAKVQALALADFYAIGRHVVYKVGDHYEVRFDEAKTRDGVDESDILFQAHSHCNSGTRSYRECRDAAEAQILMED